MLKLKVWSLITCLLVVAIALPPPHGEAAVSCTTVYSSLIPCLSYVTRGGSMPVSCCNGIKSLSTAAKTTSDRRSVCSCLKSAASSVPGINFQYAAQLPGKCGVNIPFKISPKVDCSKVK